MTYQAPQHIDNNIIFLVNRSEIEGRLDPHYNKPEYLELMQILSSIREGMTTIKKNSAAIWLDSSTFYNTEYYFRVRSVKKIKGKKMMVDKA